MGSLMVATEPLAAKSRCFLPSLMASETTAAASRYVPSTPASCLVVMVISTTKDPRENRRFGDFYAWVSC